MNPFRLLGSACLAAAVLSNSSHGAAFVAEVMSYLPGTFAAGDGASGFTNTGAALGSPSPIVGAGTDYPGNFSPFNAHYQSSELVAIGQGGQITLRLSNYVTIDHNTDTLELGVWENVFLTADFAEPFAVNGNFGSDSAVVEVSEDGITWYALSSGQPIAFDLPGNYFVNSTGPYDLPPANPVYADFGKSFTGSVSQFNGKTYSESVALLNGSAGGTWLSLDSVPLSQIGFVRFSGVASGSSFELDAVALNIAFVGAATPEPSVGLLLSAALAVGVSFRRRQ
jgi:hypothetical protein